MLLPTFLKKSKWKVNERPYELNLVGFRSTNTKANRFDDTFVCFFKNRNGFWEINRYDCTTDTGTYWLKNPMTEGGTAMLQAGQYVNAYQLGSHRGKYEALVQRGEVLIRRDYNKDNRLDFMNGKLMKGYYGINIHRASSNGTTKFVDEYSAGCQVLANANDFNELISLARNHANMYGNQFTYGLIDNRMQQRTILRRTAYATSLFALGAVGLSIYEKQKLVA
ncbi:hypothetical protein [Bernardetia sp. MNP-M8]|uniref:hypothetical protein n=1 Tax=Bernardetia sp. MNP-M8 TaxID=3127470 RepID=UPI0030CDDF6D